LIECLELQLNGRPLSVAPSKLATRSMADVLVKALDHPPDAARLFGRDTAVAATLADVPWDMIRSHLLASFGENEISGVVTSQLLRAVVKSVSRVLKPKKYVAECIDV
jgi:hypothetical protein